MKTVKMTYVDAVKALSSKIFAVMDKEGFEMAVEYGLRGVRQLPNDVLREEWEIQFEQVLAITDAQANPNGETDLTLNGPDL